MSWWINRKEMYARCEEFSKSIDSERNDNNMAENIHEASTSGAQKIRTRTTTSTTTTPITSESLQQFHNDRSAPTRLDVLPTEILEKILQLLPHDDLLATMNTSDRIQDVIKSSIVLQLHLEDKRIVLKKASVRLYWFKAVTTNRSLRLHLASVHTFVRYLPELQGHDHTRAVAQSNLYYGHPHLEAKMEYLLLIAAQRVEPLEHHLFVVIASNDDEGNKIAQDLVKAGYEAAFFTDYNSAEAYDRISKGGTKLFFVVSNVGLDFRKKGMRGIVDFRPLSSLNTDFFKLHTLNPRTLFTYVNIQDRQQLYRASYLVQLLEAIGPKPLKYGSSVEIRSDSFVSNL